MMTCKRIVVGVDGSESSIKALAWAADMAENQRAELAVMMAWAPSPPPLSGMEPTHSTHDSSDPVLEAKEKLLEVIRTVLGDDPRIRVYPELRSDSPAKALIEASSDADLLVVGSRGFGGFVGIVLGSVSQQVSAHAHCTVVVVR